MRPECKKCQAPLYVEVVAIWRAPLCFTPSGVPTAVVASQGGKSYVITSDRHGIVTARCDKCDYVETFEVPYRCELALEESVEPRPGPLVFTSTAQLIDIVDSSEKPGSRVYLRRYRGAGGEKIEVAGEQGTYQSSLDADSCAMNAIRTGLLRKNFLVL
jgi:hypothetical protein